MIEAKEDISLVVERQLRDIRESREHHQAIVEGREVHPAILQQQAAATNTTTLEVIPGQANAVPPGTPAAPTGTVPVAFKLTLAAVFILVGLLIKQRLARQESD